MADASRPTRRYSDRFFGGNGQTGAETRTQSAETLRDPATRRGGEAREPDVSEVGVERRPNISRLERWRMPVAIGLAFAIGASGGAYGWDRWRDHTTLLAAQAEIDVSTTVTSAGWLSEGYEASVEFVNDGPYDVRMSHPTFVDPVLSTGETTSFTVPSGGRVTRVLSLSVACPTDEAAEVVPTASSAAIRADVTTADGSHHLVTLPSGADDANQLAIVSSGCMTIGGSTSLYFSTTSVSVTEGASGGAGTDGTPGGGLDIVTHLVLGDANSYGGPAMPGPGGPTEVVIEGVKPGYGTNVYVVTPDPALPRTMSPGDVMTVAWDIGDCDLATRATDIDMTLSFIGHLVDQPTVQGSYLSDVPIDLAIALVRLADERCG